MNKNSDETHGLASLLATRTATAGVVGLGYVGLPLAVAIAAAGFKTIGFDIDQAKVLRLNASDSYIEAVSDDTLHRQVATGGFSATAGFEALAQCDIIIVCVPTPLSKQREPDLRFVVETIRTIARHLRRGQLVVLESTTYPGTTDEVVRPILEEGGLLSGTDFFLGFSPEREDPGNARYRTTNIPKVVAGDGPIARSIVETFYAAVVEQIVTVSSPAAAEAVKITENVFRAVNIALVNELKLIFDAMGIDVWEVIEAAASKPFGYMPFYPGPGLGGHCIPIDPFYLTWKAREYGLSTRFIELAGEINVAMPRYVIARLEQSLDQRLGLSLSSARVLIVGLAYKKNISDVRESPSFALLEILARRGVTADYHDPHVSEVPPTREHANFTGRLSQTLTNETVASYDAVIIATDHDAIDYHLIARHSRLIIDTRNAMAGRGITSAQVVKA